MIVDELLDLVKFPGDVVLDAGVGLEVKRQTNRLAALDGFLLARLQLRQMPLHQLEQHLHVVELLQVQDLPGQAGPDLIDGLDLAEDFSPLRVNW
jgi:hypothetical protein